VRKYPVTLISIFITAASLSLAHAADVGLNIGINLGNLPVAVTVAPPVEVVEPPEFMAQPGLGFYVAVGTPHDLFYADNRYYSCRGDSWYAASNYNGPWVSIGYRTLPWQLRRYPLARLRNFRDEWGRHRGDGSYAGYGHFRPERHGGGDRHARWEDRGHGGMMGY
jgi:hypothetical protein